MHVSRPHTRLPRMRSGLFRIRHPGIAHTIRGVKNEALTYLTHDALLDLAEAVLNLERRQRAGVIIEAGVALGGSAIVLAAAKAMRRPLFAYDTFGMIPPPSDKDGPEVQRRYQEIASGNSKGIGGGLYYGYEKNLYERVGQTFERFGFDLRRDSIDLVKGPFQETLKVDGPVALAHIDCDWYESVLTCLRAIEPNLARGGMLIIDDYDYWSGCRVAVDEYFSDKDPESFKFLHKARLQIIKS